MTVALGAIACMHGIINVSLPSTISFKAPSLRIKTCIRVRAGRTDGGSASSAAPAAASSASADDDRNDDDEETYDPNHRVEETEEVAL